MKILSIQPTIRTNSTPTASIISILITKDSNSHHPNNTNNINITQINKVRLMTTHRMEVATPSNIPISPISKTLKTLAIRIELSEWTVSRWSIPKAWTIKIIATRICMGMATAMTWADRTWMAKANPTNLTEWQALLLDQDPNSIVPHTQSKEWDPLSLRLTILRAWWCITITMALQMAAAIMIRITHLPTMDITDSKMSILPLIGHSNSLLLFGITERTVPNMTLSAVTRNSHTSINHLRLMASNPII